MRLTARWAILGVLCGAVASAKAADPASSAETDLPSLGQLVAQRSVLDSDEPGRAGAVSGIDKGGDPPDLTLGNFFSAGWDEDFTRRSSEGRAPDLALLRVQTNFMEREVRVNYFLEDNLKSKTQQNVQDVDAFIAYAFDRRFMLEVFSNYEWVDARTGHDTDGPAAQLVGRVQLVSTAESSYTFNFRFVAPDRGIGQTQTTFSYGLAGFEDLTEWLGLYRVGLYYSALFDSLAGPGAAGATQNDVAYDITIAKTLTRPDTPFVGNFTVFVENYAQTNLDGDNAGRTLVTVTPGVRFNLGKLPGVKLGLDNWVMGGVDIPVAGPHPWDATYRLTYIKNF